MRLFSGVALGAIPIMPALGVSIVFGMLGVVNFAHGRCRGLQGANRGHRRRAGLSHGLNALNQEAITCAHRNHRTASLHWNGSAAPSQPTIASGLVVPRLPWVTGDFDRQANTFLF
jgi:hypothetical protein